MPVVPNNLGGSQSNINSFHLIGSVGAGTLRISGFTASVDDGYVDTIRSFDPKASMEPAVYANGLHFSDATNRLFVKNLTSQALTVSGALYPVSTSESSKSLAIPAQQVPAYSASEIDLTKIVLGQFLDGAAIKLEANGPPASLIASYSSHDASAHLTRSVPFKSLGDPSLTNGAYPWRLDGQFQSRIYITNVGSEVGKIAATIRPENGTPFAIDTRSVQPGETAVYDLRQMRDDQTVDPNGVKLPKNAAVGQFDWTTLFNDGTQRFIGRNEVVDASSGISASFSCPTCSCPASYVSGFANPANLVVSQGGTGNVVATGVSSCSGTVTLTNFSTIASSWSYGIPDVVQLTTGATPSVLTGMAVGGSSFTTTQTGNLIVYEGPITGCVTMAPPQVPITGGGCVGTAIAGLNPVQGGVGTTVPVTISGCNFSTTVANNTINAGPGIDATVSSVGSGGNSLSASFAISPTASVGAVQVTVTVANGEGGHVTTNPASFTITPTITGISPLQGGLIGNTVSISISGMGFGTNPSVIAPTGITASTQSSSNTQISATLAIATTVAGGNQAIQVKNTQSGLLSNSGTFFVQIPKTLVRSPDYGENGLGEVNQFLDGSVINIYGDTQLTNQCGVYEIIGYQLVDQRQPAQYIYGNYNLQEQFSAYSSTVQGATAPQTQNNPIVLSQTILGDTQYYGKTAPACPGANDNEQFNQSFSVIIGSATYPLSMVNTVKRGFYSGDGDVTVTIKTP
jgi:hypothetical protein